MLIRLSATGASDVVREFSNIERAIDSLNGKLGGIETQTRIMAANAVANLTRMAVDIGRQVGEMTIGVGVAFNVMSEQAHVAFEKIIGDAGKAEKFFQDLRQIAIESPLNLSEVRNGAQQLLGMGIAAEKVIPIMRMLTDAASAMGGNMGDRIYHIALALGQMANSATVHAQDMNQFVQAGIPAWDNLARAIGKSVNETRDLAQKGMISGITAANAQLDYLEKNFNGVATRMGHTLGGLAATLREDLLPQATGALLEPITNRMRDVMDSLAKNLQELPFQTRIKEAAKEIDAFLTKVENFKNQIEGLMNVRGFSVLDAALLAISTHLGEMAGSNASRAFDQITQGIGNAGEAFAQFRDTRLIPTVNALIDFGKRAADVAINGRSFASEFGPAGDALDKMRSALQGVFATIDQHKELLVGALAAFLAFRGLNAIVPIMATFAAALEAISAAFAVGGAGAGMSSLLTFLAPGGPLTIGLVALAVASGVLVAAWLGDWGNIQEKTSVTAGVIGNVIDRMKEKIGEIPAKLAEIAGATGQGFDFLGTSFRKSFDSAGQVIDQEGAKLRQKFFDFIEFMAPSGGQFRTDQTFFNDWLKSLFDPVGLDEDGIRRPIQDAIGRILDNIMRDTGGTNINTDFLGDSFRKSFASASQVIDQEGAKLQQKLRDFVEFMAPTGGQFRTDQNFFNDWLKSLFDPAGLDEEGIRRPLHEAIGRILDGVMRATGGTNVNTDFIGESFRRSFDAAGESVRNSGLAELFDNIGSAISGLIPTTHTWGDELMGVVRALSPGLAAGLDVLSRYLPDIRLSGVEFKTVGDKIDVAIAFTGLFGNALQGLSQIAFGQTVGAQFDSIGKAADAAKQKTLDAAAALATLAQHKATTFSGAPGAQGPFPIPQQGSNEALSDYLEHVNTIIEANLRLEDVQRQRAQQERDARQAEIDAQRGTRLDPTFTGPPKDESSKRGRAIAETAIEGFMRELASNTANFKAAYSELAAKAAAAFSEAFATNTGGAGATAARTMDAYIDKLRESGIANWRQLGDELAGTFHDALLTRLDSLKDAALAKLAEIDEIFNRKNVFNVENFTEAFNNEIGKANLGSAGDTLMRNFEKGMRVGGADVIQTVANTAHSIIQKLIDTDPASAGDWARQFMGLLNNAFETGTIEARETLENFLRWLNTEAPIITARAKADTTINIEIDKTSEAIGIAQREAQERKDALHDQMTDRINIRNVQEQIAAAEEHDLELIKEAARVDLERLKNASAREKIIETRNREDMDRAAARSDASIDRAESRAEQLRQFFRGQHGTPSAISISGSAGQIDEMKRQWAKEDERIARKNKAEDARLGEKRRQQDTDAEHDRENADKLGARQLFWANWEHSVRTYYQNVRHDYQDQLDLDNISKQSARIDRDLAEKIDSLNEKLDGVISKENTMIDNMVEKMTMLRDLDLTNTVSSFEEIERHAHQAYEYMKAVGGKGSPTSPVLVPTVGPGKNPGIINSPGGGGGGIIIQNNIRNEGFVVGENGLAQFAKVNSDEMTRQLRVLSFTGGN